MKLWCLIFKPDFLLLQNKLRRGAEVLQTPKLFHITKITAAKPQFVAYETAWVCEILCLYQRQNT